MHVPSGTGDARPEPSGTVLSGTVLSGTVLVDPAPADEASADDDGTAGLVYAAPRGQPVPSA